LERGYLLNIMGVLCEIRYYMETHKIFASLTYAMFIMKHERLESNVGLLPFYKNFFSTSFVIPCASSAVTIDDIREGPAELLNHS
jgi:hypothetical protein